MSIFCQVLYVYTCVFVRLHLRFCVSITVERFSNATMVRENNYFYTIMFSTYGHTADRCVNDHKQMVDFEIN